MRSRHRRAEQEPGRRHDGNEYLQEHQVGPATCPTRTGRGPCTAPQIAIDEVTIADGGSAGGAEPRRRPDEKREDDECERKMRGGDVARTGRRRRRRWSAASPPKISAASPTRWRGRIAPGVPRQQRRHDQQIARSASPSHHVDHNGPNAVHGCTPPMQRLRTPTVALTIVLAAAPNTIRPTACAERVERLLEAGETAQQSRGEHGFTRVAGRDGERDQRRLDAR